MKKVTGVKPIIAWFEILVPGLDERQINRRFTSLLINERVPFVDGENKSILGRLMS